MFCAFGLMVIGSVGLIGMGGHRDTAPWLHPHLREIAFGLPIGLAWGTFALDGLIRHVLTARWRLLAIAGGSLLLITMALAAVTAVRLLKG